MSADARRLSGAALSAALRESRAATLARTFDLDDAAWQLPFRADVNPIAWELGHLAWFAEFWILRGPHARNEAGFVEAARGPRWSGADAIFDSARLAHADRWTSLLPPREALKATLEAQLEACLAALPRDAGDDAAHYFHRLALFHEDMHGEAFAWSRATLGQPAPAGLEAMPAQPEAPSLRLTGGELQLGRAADAPGFPFDNELPGRQVVVAPFELDATPLGNGRFLRFVEAGGYAEPAFWPGPAGLWRSRHAHDHPERWRQAGGSRWQARWFDRWQDLDPGAPVVHVSAWEAEAFCRWAGRRLPAAAEWEFAARDPRLRWGGSVWEWTADAFLAYPGFAAGPYADYSRPWFGDHRELRGGSFATNRRLHHRGYRNFFTPDRSDVFAGFRTVAASS